MPHKPSFSKDDFLKMEDAWFAPQAPSLGSNPLKDALRASIQGRKPLGLKLPSLTPRLPKIGA